MFYCSTIVSKFEFDFMKILGITMSFVILFSLPANPQLLQNVGLFPMSSFITVWVISKCCQTVTCRLDRQWQAEDKGRNDEMQRSAMRKKRGREGETTKNILHCAVYSPP